MKYKDTFNIKGQYIIRKYRDGVLIWESPVIENMLMLTENRGLAIIFNRLLGVKTHDLEITSLSIGKDDTPPTDENEDLGDAIVEDIPYATRSRIGLDEIQLEYFISDNELPDDDYEEIGLFTGTGATKRLFARSIIEPTFTKSTGEDIALLYTIKLT